MLYHSEEIMRGGGGRELIKEETSYYDKTKGKGERKREGDNKMMLFFLLCYCHKSLLVHFFSLSLDTPVYSRGQL